MTGSLLLMMFLWVVAAGSTGGGGGDNASKYASTADYRIVTWHTPTVEPQHNIKRQPIIGGAMPVGNGETVALVFPLAGPTSNETAADPASGFKLPHGSVSFLVNMATAMASDTSLFGLGMVSLVTVPPLFPDNTRDNTSFEQTLDIATATVSILGDSADGVSFRANVSVDAVSNTVSVTLHTSVPVVLSTTVQSLHPSTRFSYYNKAFGHATCEPDHFATSLEAGPGRIAISHRNEDSDFPAVFNYTLQAEGLDSLQKRYQQSDRWRHRQFGMLLSGTAGHDLLARKDAATLVSAEAASSFELTVSTAAVQTVSSSHWYSLIRAQHAKAIGMLGGSVDAVRLVTAAALRRQAHHSWWNHFWSRSKVEVSSTNASEATGAARLTQQYAIWRYLSAIQAGTWVPIKFNGQLFTSQIPPETMNSGPTFRDWGSNSWWQNTRLPYWSMAPAGDFEQFETIFAFYSQTIALVAARTQAYFGHPGIFYTEVKTLFGLFSTRPYGTNASTRGQATSLPISIEASPYIHFDYGGNAGGTEVSMMILDHFLYTQNETVLKRYFPIVAQTLDFFVHHYKNRTANGELVIYPTQALETYWCAPSSTTGGNWTPPFFDASHNRSNCIVNDHPTVVALHVLIERALQLPTAVVGTATQRAQWKAFQRILPAVPVIIENGFLSTAPYGSYPINSALHNSETPELYSTHPFRYFSLGRSLLGETRRDAKPALNCLREGRKIRDSCGNAKSNNGWNQGVMNAALLGDAQIARAQVLARAGLASATGYRFQGFAPHEQDFEPSADQLSNMNSALNWMLLQPADDGFVNGSAIAFGAWPCSWDVEFKLAAPLNTTVEAVFTNGKVRSFVVTPAHRASFVHVQACQDV